MRWLSSALLTFALWAPSAAAQDADTTGEVRFEIVRLELRDSPNGYRIPDDSVFYPGEQVHIAFNLSGYRISEDYRMKVRYRIETTSPLGKPFAVTEGGEWDEEIAPQDEGWEPAAKYTATLPPHAGPGIYTIRIEATDELANATTTKELAVQVEGDAVETTEDLSIRKFQFTLTEGGTPLGEEPTVPRGQTLWASFYITGYLMSSDNSYDVSSTMRIIDDKGETMIAFEPKGEKGSPFFPRVWLPGGCRLDLDDNVRSGRYTILLEVEDKLGGTSFQTEEVFRVR